MTSAHTEQKHWYACRIFHNQTKNVKAALTDEAIRFFIPCRVLQQQTAEGILYQEEPIIPSLVFIQATPTYIRSLKKQFATHLGFYQIPGTQTAAVIPNHEMEIFMYVLSKGCQQLETIDEKLVKGSHVRITGGPFEGAEGYITRVHGTKRFVVLVHGIAAVATTFIPRCHIEKID